MRYGSGASWRTVSSCPAPGEYSSQEEAEQGVDTTFSLVARCAASGDLAVAVSTARLAVGNRVPFALARTAAVATQANTNPELGRQALGLIQAGASAQQALEQVLARDPDQATRQLSIIDARGNRAVFTGERILRDFPWAGSLGGEDCMAAGNILTGQETLETMVDVFERSSGFIGERALRALEAGQAAGGDARGKVSAALLVVRHGHQPLLDLRIDRSDNPVQELRLLYNEYMAAFLPSV